MDYRRFGDKIVVRIDKGEELCEKVLELAGKENIRLAGVTGLGASNDVTLGVFNTASKVYHKTRLQRHRLRAGLRHRQPLHDGRQAVLASARSYRQPRHG